MSYLTLFTVIMSVDNIDFPCIICTDNCVEGQEAICCSICEEWTHLNCSNLSKKRFNILSKSAMPYYCAECYLSVICPCCNEECTSTQNSIYCFYCNKWLHLNCTSLNIDEFNTLSQSELDYSCENCMKSIHPFGNLNNDELITLFDNPCLSSNSTCNVNAKKIDITSLNNISNSPYVCPDDFMGKFYKSNNLSVLSINIRSLNKNFIKLELLLDQLKFKPDIISVGETWINHKKTFLYSLKGYNFIDEPCDGKAGGVAFFIKSSIEYNVLNSFKLNVKECEELWLELSLFNNKKLVIASIYRHPDYNFTEFQQRFLSVIETLNKLNKNFIITGDTNINLLKRNSSIISYKNEVLSHGCTQLVDNSTRFSWKNTGSLIDHVYTNLNQDNIFTKTLIYDISDHLPNITLTDIFQPKEQNNKLSLIRDTSKFVPEHFLSELNEKLNQFIINDQISAEDTWNLFENTFDSVLNNHAPFRPQTRKESKRSKKPWITKAILISIKKKHKLFKQVHNKKSSVDWSIFTKYRNKLSHIIEHSKRNYFKSQVINSKSNPKKLWKTINDIINLKPRKDKQNITLSDNTGNPITDSNEISNSFNKFFTNIGVNLSNKIPPPSNNFKASHTTKNFNHSFFLSPLTNTDVEQYIRSLNPNKSTKSNCPSFKYIKLSINIISPVLTKIFNKCISEGVFPKSLKVAEVVPIFKKGDKNVTGNYRPISLLSPFSKIFERHIYNQLYNFVTKHKILHTHQYGFRTNSSTEMAITQLHEHITSKIDQSSIACSIFIDLQKAFDTVNHSILMSKLLNYGVRGLPAKLINSYLSDRYQKTIVNTHKSNSEQILCGVPQGSILGPLLFLLYINNLPEATSFQVKLFADDACLILDNSNPKTLQENINNELVNVDNWMRANKLSINYTKTHYIIFSRKKCQYNFRLCCGGFCLERVASTKYLGVVVDEKLNWSHHINYIHSKLCRASYIISKLRHYVNTDTLKMIYYSLAYPHLSYCISAWGGAPNSLLRPLNVVQNKIVRLITFSDFSSHAPPLFHKLQLLTITDIYKLNLVIMIHNFQNNKFTGSTDLTPLNKFHKYNTRLSSNNNYYQNFHKTNVGKSTFSIAGLKFWRSLPVDLKSQTLPVFKFKLKKLMISSYA